MQQCHDYTRIFHGSDGKPPGIETVDAIISGIGNVESSATDPWFLETVEAEGMKDNDLNSISVGNLGGVWFPKRQDDDNTIEEINRRWLGVQQEHFEKCVLRAKKKGPSSSVGVVVLAVGRDKARIVNRSVGLINHLIIDHTLAQAILKVTEQTP